MRSYAHKQPHWNFQCEEMPNTKNKRNFNVAPFSLVSMWAYVRSYGILSGDRIRGIFRMIFRTCLWNVNDNVFAICIGVCFMILSVRLLPVVTSACQCLSRRSTGGCKNKSSISYEQFHSVQMGTHWILSLAAQCDLISWRRMPSRMSWTVKISSSSRVYRVDWIRENTG